MKLSIHGGRKGPVSEIMELCRQSLSIHIANLSSGNISQQVLRTFDNLYGCSKLPIYVAYNLYPRSTNRIYPIHRDANAVLASAAIPTQDS